MSFEFRRADSLSKQYLFLLLCWTSPFLESKTFPHFLQTKEDIIFPTKCYCSVKRVTASGNWHPEKMLLEEASSKHPLSAIHNMSTSQVFLFELPVKSALV
jgi:hypothetical protein